MRPLLLVGAAGDLSTRRLLPILNQLGVDPQQIICCDILPPPTMPAGCRPAVWSQIASRWAQIDATDFESLGAILRGYKTVNAYVATPPATHADVVRALIGSGHARVINLEKGLPNRSLVESLYAAANDGGVILRPVDHYTLYSATSQLKDWWAHHNQMRSETVVEVHMRLLEEGPIPQHRVEALRFGVAADLLVHLLAVSRIAFGSLRGIKVQKVSAERYADAPVQGPTCISTRLWLPSHRLFLTLEAGFGAQKACKEIEVVGPHKVRYGFGGEDPYLEIVRRVLLSRTPTKMTRRIHLSVLSVLQMIATASDQDDLGGLNGSELARHVAARS